MRGTNETSLDWVNVVDKRKPSSQIIYFMMASVPVTFRIRYWYHIQCR